LHKEKEGFIILHDIGEGSKDSTRRNTLQVLLTEMSTNKKNKYKTTTKTKEWFPFAKYLFETAKHPILLSTVKCSSSIEALFCQQELEQINGITNSLQCEQRDAVRIALFETIRHAEAANQKSYAKAKAGSAAKGHEGRNSLKRFNLPKTEKEAAEKAATELGITVKEFLRLAVIWLADGIKEESITRLTNSRRMNKDTVAKQWSRANQGKTASEQVAKLKEARDKAYEEATARGQEYDDHIYAERGRMMDILNDSGIGRALQQASPTMRKVNGHNASGINLNMVDAYLAVENEEWVEQALKEEEKRREMDELEREIFRTMLMVPEGEPMETIEAIAKETIEERKEQKQWMAFLENTTDEELIDKDYVLFWQLRTPFTYEQMEEFTWKDEADAERRQGESSQDYVSRSLPANLVEAWVAYSSD
jgi:hypothetical protein